jgi:phage-related tail fiber protein
MPIAIVSNLIPKNSGPFPVVEDRHVKGGFHTYATLVDRDSIPPANKKVGMHVYCAETNLIYVLDSDLTTWIESIDYVHPTGDGNLHVPDTGTSNNGKVLTAGSTAGSLSWTMPTNGTVTTVSGNAPLVVSNGSDEPIISIPAATSSSDGYLKSTDWVLFNSKGSGSVVNVTGTSPINVSNGDTTPVISIADATVSVSGAMSSSDKIKLDGLSNYTLPISTTVVLGGIKSGNGVSVDVDGVLSIQYGSSANTSVQGNDARVVADQAAATASIRTLGTGALQAAAGNHNHSLDTLSNVTITSNSDGEFLTWDSASLRWINRTALESGIATTNHSHSVLSNGAGIAPFSYDGSASATVGLSNTAVTSGTYGSALRVSTFTVDTHGRLTAASDIEIQSASTSQKGIVQLNNTTTSTATDQAATANVVKIAYDLASSAIQSTQKGANNGVAELDANGKIVQSQLPSITITDTFVVASETAMLAVVAETGDVVVRTDLSKSFILRGTDPSVLSDWEELLSPTTGVTSVNGQTGAVTITTVEGNASTATSLVSARTIEATGDAYWSVSFDGSANVSSTLTFANSGVVAGTYNNSATSVTPFTVDSKGRITSVGSAIDITADWSSISNKPTTLSGYGITDSASSTHNHALDSLSNVQVTSNTVGEILKWSGTAWINNTLAEAGIQPAGSYLTENQTITVSGDVAGSGTTTIELTLANIGVSAGTYKSVSVDAKGRVTSGTNPTTLAGYGITDAASTSHNHDADYAPIVHVGSTGNSHGVATTSVAGFMSSSDKTKLDGIASNANNYSHPTGDGNLHVPATGTSNNGKVLTAGATAGSLSWATPSTYSHPTSGVVAGTYTKVTVNVDGHVTVGASLVATDIPGLDWSKITSGKPTTLSGYGITDAASTSHDHNSAYLSRIVGSWVTSSDSANRFNFVSSGATNYGSPTGVYNWYNSTSSTINLTLNNSGDLVATGNVSAYSDPRLKEDMTRIFNPLNLLSFLNGYSFTWRNGTLPTACKAGKFDFGLNADEVYAVMPHLISEMNFDGTNYRTVAYDKLIPVLIEAVKQLNEKIQFLEAEVDSLR